MPVYKLTYFPVRALAEPIRFLFSYADIEFIDERFDKADWPEIKPTMPFGQVPVLEIDGKKINQSSAICRYLAKKCNLAGKNDLEALEIDAAVENIHDLRHKIASFHYESNETVKADKRREAEKTVSFFLGRLNDQVKNNGGYFVGTLSWADLTFVALLDYLNFMMEKDILEEYENLKQLKQKVLEIPAIKRWVDKRPQSQL